MLKLYNTLTRKKAVLETLEDGHVKLYVCGPTVYDYAHLGHARSCTVYDLMVRHLRSQGMRVTYVRNITDIDDKIIQRALERRVDPVEISTQFTHAFLEDMGALGNLEPDVQPKVSEHLDDIFSLLSRIIENGGGYAVDGDVYFRVRSFNDYGKLSGTRLDQLEAGASGRTGTEESKKEDPLDFALWKRSADSEPGWESPWGRGRPGWHAECSAMSMKYLGESFDVHGGGLDLVFPHHENEVAQSETATGKPYAHTWVHNGFVEVNKEKMSKSLGNFFTFRELCKQVEAEAIRYFLLTVHYRAPLGFDWSLDGDNQVSGFPQLEEAERRVEYLYATKSKLLNFPESRIQEGGLQASLEITALAEALCRGLDDDLNTPVALSAVAAFLTELNELLDNASKKKKKLSPQAHSAALSGFSLLGQVLGLGADAPNLFAARVRDRRAAKLGLDHADIARRIEEREQARISKDFEKADAVRQALLDMGVELMDTAGDTTWTIR